MAVASTPVMPSSSDGAVLRVKDLKTYFFTYDGTVRALDGVTFTVRPGETLGLVGETGCGKSVTAFSITRLVADPPGRGISGEIEFKGANLLWDIDREAKYKPVKGTPRITVRRRYGRIKAAQLRLSAVRGKHISMIFQEPTAAMNPVFSIWKQVGEALEIHRIVPMSESLLHARPPAQADEARMARDLLDAAREPGQPRLREVAASVAKSVGVPTLESELYHLLHGPVVDSASSLSEITRTFQRLRLSGIQRRYLQFRRTQGQMDRELKDLFLREMQERRSYGAARRVKSAKISSLRLSNSWLRVPGLAKIARRPLENESFWQVVMTLESVGIANPVQIARGYPHELSGGMLQRVMIAMALAPEPALLIADEPTTALDVTIQAQILDLMNDLKRRVGTSIIFITHDLAVIAETCERMCVMYAGVIAEAGLVKEIFRKPLHPYSQGLLSSIPRLDDPDKKLESIPGSVPNLIHPPDGCRFHPRCPFVMDKCKSTRPPMVEKEPGHFVACWLYDGPQSTEY